MSLRYFVGIFVVIGALLACSGSQPVVNIEDIYTIDSYLISDGWTKESVSQDSEWGSSNNFLTIFVKRRQDRRNLATFDFIVYISQKQAAEAYETYYDASFYSGVDSSIIWSEQEQVEPNLENMDEVEVLCTNAVVGERCVSWMRYERCVMRLQSPIGEDGMSYNTFEDILESGIDLEITQNRICS